MTSGTTHGAQNCIYSAKMYAPSPGATINNYRLVCRYYVAVQGFIHLDYDGTSYAYTRCESYHGAAATYSRSIGGGRKAQAWRAWRRPGRRCELVARDCTREMQGARRHTRSLGTRTVREWHVSIGFFMLRIVYTVQGKKGKRRRVFLAVRILKFQIVSYKNVRTATYCYCCTKVESA